MFDRSDFKILEKVNINWKDYDDIIISYILERNEYDDVPTILIVGIKNGEKHILKSIQNECGCISLNQLTK